MDKRNSRKNKSRIIHLIISGFFEDHLLRDLMKFIYLCSILGGLSVIIAGIFFSLGMHQKPTYIQNFEEGEYGSEHAFVTPSSIVDGLAVYSVGSGEPVLLFPYPHAHTTAPMAQEPIAESLLLMGRKVITFDVPGAYRSTRTPTGNMDEMIQAADETLDRLGIEGPIDVVGHSMGGFTALAYATERPERIQRLVLINNVSGFPAAARCGFPGSAFSITDPNYWRIIFWGIRINAGRGNLALHKKLQNLMEGSSYHDKSYFTPLVIDADDYEKGVPIRMIWSKNMYSGLSYADRLSEVKSPTLILAGRHDPEAPLACSEELNEGILESRLIIFEHSGHYPFIEESLRFHDIVEAFLQRAN
jgi:proline iminopeptidase